MEETENRRLLSADRAATVPGAKYGQWSLVHTRPVTVEMRSPQVEAAAMAPTAALLRNRAATAETAMTGMLQEDLPEFVASILESPVHTPRRAGTPAKEGTES
jgi:hypothetical protein